MDKSLIIFRGLPGSGKSTLAKVLSEGKIYPVLSIDDYFTNSETGDYSFDYSQNHLAYKNCQERTEEWMKKGVVKIFLDNCFTLEWEMEPYFKMAATYNYKVFVITVENRHGSLNIHNISFEQLKKMAEKYKVVLIP